MNPKQVSDLLRANGANDKAITIFLDNNISGQTIVDGIDDDDLKEIGFTASLQRRGIKDIIKLMMAEGWLYLITVLLLVVLMCF